MTMIIGIAPVASLETITEQIFDETISINLKSVFLVTQACLPKMRAAKWGRIINISSVAAYTGIPFFDFFDFLDFFDVFDFFDLLDFFEFRIISKISKFSRIYFFSRRESGTTLCSVQSGNNRAHE